MFYVIKDSGVVSGANLKVLNAKLNAKMDESEFTICGPDFVCRMTNQDIDFVQDKRKMENLLFAGFFRKDNSAKLISMMNLVFTFVLMIMIASLGK